MISVSISLLHRKDNSQLKEKNLNTTTHHKTPENSSPPTIDKSTAEAEPFITEKTFNAEVTILFFQL